MEVNRAKDRNTRHRPPKRPHIKRKPMRQSKHTHERQTRHTGKKCANHGKGGEGEREPNSNAPAAMRAGTHCQRNTGTEGAPARPPQIAQAAPHWRGIKTRLLNVRKPRISSHFLRMSPKLHFLPLLQNLATLRRSISIRAGNEHSPHSLHGERNS